MNHGKNTKAMEAKPGLNICTVFLQKTSQVNTKLRHFVELCFMECTWKENQKLITRHPIHGKDGSSKWLMVG